MEWCKHWLMRLNLEKCVTLQFYKTFSPLLTSYTIENHTLENVNQQQYLGVILDRTMSFTKQINDIISKASKVLNFVKRNLFSCLQSTTYFSLVRPTFEHASSVWTLLKHSTLPVLRRFKEELLAGCYSRYSSVTTMLQQLHWPTLDTRCKKAWLSLLYKISLHFIFHHTSYKTHHNETRLHHQSSFMYPHIRTSTCMNSFYPKEWNTDLASKCPIQFTYNIISYI